MMGCIIMNKKNVIILLLACIVMGVISFIKSIQLEKEEMNLSSNESVKENLNSSETSTEEEELPSYEKQSEEEILSSKEQVEKDIEAFLLTKDQEDSWLYEITTPTGEPDRKYHVEYAIVDSTKDGIPELHIRNPREYDVFSFTDGEKRQIFFDDSSGCRKTVQKDGTIVKLFYDRWTYGIGIEFSQIDLNGNEYDNKFFGWEDTNSNGSIDVKEDYFSYNGEQIEFDEWKTLCDGYIDIDIEKGLVGGFVIEDEAEWKILQEEVR